MKTLLDLDLTFPGPDLPGDRLPSKASDVARDAVNGTKGAQGEAHPGRGKGLDKDKTPKKGKKDAEPEDDASPVDPIDAGLLLVGGTPDELIVGLTGNDELYGGRGDDVVAGGAGNDFLSGNQGDDVLVGGAGCDTFCFDGDFDTETVADFSVQDGDRLKFILYTPAQAELDAAGLLDLFAQEGRDAVLRFAGTDERVVLHEVDVDDLTADMISVTIIPPATDLIG